MKKNCKLIGTLPNIHDKSAVNDMLSSNDISEVRFNSGVNVLISESEIASILKTLQTIYKKKIYVDLKGRQLRVEAWADPYYEAIELNHDIEIMYPAKVIFRGGNQSNIIHTRGNKIILDSRPEKAIGKGQSVNIHAKNLEIKGYLTEHDKKLIRECSLLGLDNYMASFVESDSDIAEILSIDPNAKIISKIESPKGIEFISNGNFKGNLMAARDDLYLETGSSYKMLSYLKKIIEKDPKAICASRILESLKTENNPSLNDFEDLELMYEYGYRNFMLGDDVKGPVLKRTLKAWSEFNNE